MVYGNICLEYYSNYLGVLIRESIIIGNSYFLSAKLIRYAYQSSLCGNVLHPPTNFSQSPARTNVLCTESTTLVVVELVRTFSRSDGLIHYLYYIRDPSGSGLNSRYFTTRTYIIKAN